MITYACNCEEGLGVAHSHVPAQVLVRFDGGRTAKINLSDVALNPGIEVLKEYEPSIQVWIDWKQVARELMLPPVRCRKCAPDCLGCNPAHIKDGLCAAHRQMEESINKKENT